MYSKLIMAAVLMAAPVVAYASDPECSRSALRQAVIVAPQGYAAPVIQRVVIAEEVPAPVEPSHCPSQYVAPVAVRSYAVQQVKKPGLVRGALKRFW